jgi:hypothetical protein
MIDAIRLTPFTLTDKESTLADQKRARAEARANEERRRGKVLTEIGVTPPEAALFNVVHYGITTPPSYLPSWAAVADYSLAGPVTEEESQAALAACLAKGWLQVIDDSALAKITDELREARFAGPIYGLPGVGDVDFTPAGAELWQRLRRRCFPKTGPPFAFTNVVHSKTTRYFRTRAAALAAIAEEDRDHAVSVTGPTPIGPWRVQWWRRFPEGYRVDIEERRQWRGGVGEGGPGCVMVRPRRKADPQQLRHVLDCHNVTLAEWLIFAAVERDLYRSASDLPKWVAGTVEEQNGVTASEEDCRTGLEACLRYGWLRVVDQHAVDEVRALLREDPALLAVPSEVESSQGETDFTPCGATLYRMIAAEWLGPDWEDALSVWIDYYREVHHYCEAEEGLRGIVHEHTARGEVVRASKLVALGPWCVYWWERFPDGYRLELKIGQP